MKEGTVNVIYGPMFAGKSTELIRRIKQSEISQYKIAIYNPSIDTRYGEGRICNHDRDSSVASIPVSNSLELLNDVTRRQVGVERVFVDEAQFFDERMPEVVDYLTKELGIDVTLVGLLHDFKGDVFGPMGELISRAHRVTSMEAICTFVYPNGRICRLPAYFTQRLVDGHPADYNCPVILVGGVENYTVRCAEHWEVPGRPRINIDTLLN